ncbi:hypothetical protein SUGI_0682860 [Cryptomeria japonica]|nr:hypothetical protein SUGI_0682860 [Cryptomeria japonica]
MDISRNYLAGSIPSSVASLRGLQLKFNLSNNRLTGLILAELGGLDMAQFVDLSNNKLPGTMPAAFGGCSNLQGLDLSSNNLQEGPVPQKFQENFNASSFENNLKLCGLNAQHPCPAGLHSHKQKAKRVVLPVALIIASAVVFCSLLCLAFIAFHWRRKKSKSDEISLLNVPSDPPRFTGRDLQNAASNFTSDIIIGSSSISSLQGRSQQWHNSGCESRED